MVNYKQICYENKCINRVGSPLVVSTHIAKFLEEAIKNGKNSVNPTEIIFKAEEKAQAEGKFNLIIKRNEEHEKLLELKAEYLKKIGKK